LRNSVKGTLGHRPTFLSDAFTRANGAIGGSWTGTNWTISSNKAVNTPTLGSELVVNGDFATDTVWTKGSGITISGGEAVATAADNSSISQAAIIPSSGFYRLTHDITNWSSGQTLISSQTGMFSQSANANGSYTWDNFFGSTDTDLALAVTGTFHIDNVSLKKIAMEDLIVTQDFGYASGRTQADITVAGDLVAGVVMNVDDPNNVQNCAIAIVSRSYGRAFLFKMVGGVISTVWSASFSYSAGGTLKLSKGHGTDYTVSYAGTSLFSKTIADAGVINNTYHGMLSTKSSTTLDNFVGVYN
jgi:hypothetical protein